jgi:hypothetical protein
MLRAMKLIMGSSFVRKKMMSGKGMPPEIRALLKKIGIVGVEEEAAKLCPYVVSIDSDDEDSGETVVEAADQAAG